jgi:hypothetical protein
MCVVTIRSAPSRSRKVATNTNVATGIPVLARLFELPTGLVR